MGGLMMALAGGLKGLGDGMIDKAKADREAAIAATLRAGQVQDRDAGYAQQDKLQGNTFAHEDTSQQAQFGQQNTITDKEIAAHHTDAQLGADTTIKAAGISAATSTANTAAQISAAKSEYGTPVQAADGSMYATNKSGQMMPIVDKTGKPVMALGRDVPGSAYAAAIKESSDADGVVDQDKLASIVQTLRANRIVDPSKIQPKQAPHPGFLERLGNFFSPPDDNTGASRGLTSNPFGAQPSPPVSTNTPPSPAAPSQAAVLFLKAHPETNQAFDLKYGQGASKRALGQ